MATKTFVIESPVKVITSGTEPTAETLGKGEIAFGSVGGKTKLYGGNGTEVMELGGDEAFNSTEDDSTATVEDLGGIAAGTTAAELKAMTVSEVLDTLIFPTVNPTFVAPSATLAWASGYASGSSLTAEVGAPAPTASNMTVTYNAGSILIAGVKKQDRAGESKGETIQASENSGTYTATLPTTLAAGNTKYRATVEYAAGPQPLDSKGGSYGSALSAGSVTSNVLTAYGVYPYFANTSSADTLTKLTLTTASSFEASCVAESSAGRHQFAVPSAYTVTKIEYFDTVANTYKTMSLTAFTATEYEQELLYTTATYKKYVRNEEGLSGATKFRVTFTKA